MGGVYNGVQRKAFEKPQQLELRFARKVFRFPFVNEQNEVIPNRLLDQRT